MSKNTKSIYGENDFPNVETAAEDEITGATVFLHRNQDRRFMKVPRSRAYQQIKSAIIADLVCKARFDSNLDLHRTLNDSVKNVVQDYINMANDIKENTVKYS